MGYTHGVSESDVTEHTHTRHRVRLRRYSLLSAQLIASLNAGGVSSNPGQGTKIPHATQPKKKLVKKIGI